MRKSESGIAEYASSLCYLWTDREGWGGSGVPFLFEMQGQL